MIEAKNYAYKKVNSYEKMTKEEKKTMQSYAEGYKSFLDAAKTEREAVAESIKMVEKLGYKSYQLGDAICAGGKYYYNNRNKNLFVFRIGTDPVEKGIRIGAAHIDSPRLDLKPNPLYEDSGFAYLKTHYYGGIRKYQWLAIPLALHGTVILTDGTVLNIVVGEDASDPIFYIDDLLPHLGKADNEKPLGTAVPGEKLNVLVGSEPIDKDESDAVKLNVLRILNEKYGIIEEDFLSAEICAVPAFKARDVGFDRSLIGAYGHDDRVCAYPSLTALLNSKNDKNTMMCILADKEEIGSDGPTGMKTELFLDLIAAIAKSQNADPAIVKANSKCLSADVSACFDPNFADVFEKNNSSIVNCGVTVSKYTGGGGKSSTNDAPAEMVAWLRNVLNSNQVTWQIAELGKIDAGGGGTVAKYISKHNIDTIDIGVGVISMHAPYEVIAKADLYMTYKALFAFYNF